MFQTEPIQFLQSLATDWLTDSLWLVSQLGYSKFYIPVLILVMFGVDFRKGFLLTQMMLCVGITTDFLKNAFALPRPSDVDSAVELLGTGLPNSTPFKGMGGAGFWELPDPEAIRTIRAQPDWSFGLPSGHVSGATTFWGGLSLLFRHAPIRVAAVVMISLMPLSRMYLGRHFLADVLAGFLLGLILLVVAHVLFIRPVADGRRASLLCLRPAASIASVVVSTSLLLTPVFLLVLRPMVEPADLGHLFGLNAAFVPLAARGLPDDTASWPRRAARVALAFAFYLGAAWLVGRVVGPGAVHGGRLWVEFLAAAIPAFAALWGGVTAGLAIGLYARLR